MQSLLYLIIGLFLVVAAVCANVAYLIAHSLSNPLIKISEVAKQIASGNLNVEFNINRTDEIGELSDAMKEMQSKLSSVIEEEIHTIVSAAGKGDLSRRIDLDGKEGFYRELSSSINDLVNESDRIISDTVGVIGAMAKGDLSKSITADYQGSFNILKSDITSMQSQLREVIEQDVQSIVRAASAGDLSQRINLDGKKGFYGELAVSINNMVDVNDRIINDTLHVVSALAGKQGFYAKLAESINDLVDVNDRIISDSVDVVTSMSKGDLTHSIEADYQGRGFAVVADEVRNLAGRSATAAKEIKDLIHDSSAKVEQGARLVNDSGETLKEIVTSVTNGIRHHR